MGDLQQHMIELHRLISKDDTKMTMPILRMFMRTSHFPLAEWNNKDSFKNALYFRTEIFTYIAEKLNWDKNCDIDEVFGYSGVNESMYLQVEGLLANECMKLWVYHIHVCAISSLNFQNYFKVVVLGW